jgi:hypothetical protein
VELEDKRNGCKREDGNEKRVVFLGIMAVALRSFTPSSRIKEEQDAADINGRGGIGTGRV